GCCATALHDALPICHGWEPTAMNIFLVPYTWARHLAVPLVVAGAALLTWWSLLVVLVGLGPWLFRMGLLWRQGLEGAIFLGLVRSEEHTSELQSREK